MAIVAGAFEERDCSGFVLDSAPATQRHCPEICAALGKAALASLLIQRDCSRQILLDALAGCKHGSSGAASAGISLFTGKLKKRNCARFILRYALSAAVQQHPEIRATLPSSAITRLLQCLGIGGLSVRADRKNTNQRGRSDRGRKSHVVATLTSLPPIGASLSLEVSKWSATVFASIVLAMESGIGYDESARSLALRASRRLEC